MGIIKKILKKVKGDTCPSCEYEKLEIVKREERENIVFCKVCGYKETVKEHNK